MGPQKINAVLAIVPSPHRDFFSTPAILVRQGARLTGQLLRLQTGSDRVEQDYVSGNPNFGEFTGMARTQKQSPAYDFRSPHQPGRLWSPSARKRTSRKLEQEIQGD